MRTLKIAGFFGHSLWQFLVNRFLRVSNVPFLQHKMWFQSVKFGSWVFNPKTDKSSGITGKTAVFFCLFAVHTSRREYQGCWHGRCSGRFSGCAADWLSHAEGEWNTSPRLLWTFLLRLLSSGRFQSWLPCFSASLFSWVSHHYLHFSCFPRATGRSEVRFSMVENNIKIKFQIYVARCVEITMG